MTRELHICDCGDCNPAPFVDRCKYEIALETVLEEFRNPSTPSGYDDDPVVRIVTAVLRG